MTKYQFLLKRRRRMDGDLRVPSGASGAELLGDVPNFWNGYVRYFP